ncbi:MAG: hypothetical protein DLM67_22555 [Candidatus Nephthysia bennettiae]|nr:MAG: hypothetical protein DLM67_22555 [Candidatus Dormibacteraeota bacterium]
MHVLPGKCVSRPGGLRVLRQDATRSRGCVLLCAQAGVLQLPQLVLGLAQRCESGLRVLRLAYRVAGLLEVLSKRLPLLGILSRPPLAGGLLRDDLDLVRRAPLRSGGGPLLSELLEGRIGHQREESRAQGRHHCDDEGAPGDTERPQVVEPGSTGEGGRVVTLALIQPASLGGEL